MRLEEFKQQKLRSSMKLHLAKITFVDIGQS